MKNINNISIILPTLNEEENLTLLIPEIVSVLEKINLLDYQLIIIDDNSTDNTKKIMHKLCSRNQKIEFFVRKSPKSLPLSIWEGIEKSKFTNVMWLDADGSMRGETIEKLINELDKNVNSVIVASRFAEGGGYKGKMLNENSNFINSMFNLRNTKESITATVLSTIFNKSLSIISKTNVKDMTSGFIVGRKEYFPKTVFKISNYGEYFVYLMSYLKKKNIRVIEIGYICGTRLYGTSKTGSSLLQLIKLGLPYIKAARIANKVDYENL